MLKKAGIMEKQYAIVDAKNKLPSLIHSVETGQAIKLTRHGKTVAVLLSIKEYDRLNQKQRGYWRALSALRGRMERERVFSENEDFETLRDSSSGRGVDFDR
jgi:prevent-host-death family protein